MAVRGAVVERGDERLLLEMEAPVAKLLVVEELYARWLEVIAERPYRAVCCSAMTLVERITQDLTAAMKAQDAARVSVLRMAKAALKNKEIDKKAPARRRRGGAGRCRASSSSARTRSSSSQKAGRQELVDKESGGDRGARGVPARRRPATPTIAAAVDAAIAETGAALAQGHGQGDEGGARGARRRPASRSTARRSTRRSASGSAGEGACVRRVGQRVMVGFEGHAASPDVKRARSATTASGTSILFARNVAAPEQVAELVRELQAVAREARPRPAADGRGRPGRRPRRAAARAVDASGRRCARVGPARLRRARARAWARRSPPSSRPAASAATSRPCVDVDTNPKNPVIGDRSFGADPELVGRLGAAMIEGLQDGRRRRLRQALPGPRRHRRRLAPRAAGRRPLARRGSTTSSCRRSARRSRRASRAIMTRHVLVRELDDDAAGDALAARSSRRCCASELEATTGVVVSDDLEMKAVADALARRGRSAVLARAGRLRPRSRSARAPTRRWRRSRRWCARVRVGEISPGRRWTAAVRAAAPEGALPAAAIAIPIRRRPAGPRGTAERRRARARRSPSARRHPGLTLVRKPRALRPGDLVGVVRAGGSGRRGAPRARASAALERLGFACAWATALLERRCFTAGSRRARGSTSCTPCSPTTWRARRLRARRRRGVLQLLPLLDPTLLRRIPSCFVGYSDVTLPAPRCSTGSAS